LTHLCPPTAHSALTYRFAKALDYYTPTWITLWGRVSFKHPGPCCYRALTASPWIAVKVISQDSVPTQHSKIRTHSACVNWNSVVCGSSVGDRGRSAGDVQTVRLPRKLAKVLCRMLIGQK